VLVAALLFATLVSCAVGRAGIQRGVIHPPIFRQQAGPLFLIARTTRTPECIAPQCGSSFAIERIELQRDYVIWLVLAYHDSTGFHLRSYQLLQVPLDQRP
jgi:hypothetical protein